MPTKQESLRGLGAKFGGTVRKRYARVFRKQKAKRACPSCGSLKFRRIAAGIWTCGICSYKVADGAYATTTV